MATKIIVGLTGGIASGKSAAAEMFREAGAYIIDTDLVSRAVSETESVRAQLRQAFPAAFDGQTLQRRALREIVFHNGEALQTLNEILHPPILAETKRLAAAADARIVVAVVPLLFETGFDAYTRPDITVACPESLRIERLMKRDNINEQLARRMLAAQMTDDERAARADIVLTNDGTLARLRAQVRRVFCELTELR